MVWWRSSSFLGFSSLNSNGVVDEHLTHLIRLVNLVDKSLIEVSEQKPREKHDEHKSCLWNYTSCISSLQ